MPSLPAAPRLATIPSAAELVKAAAPAVYEAAAAAAPAVPTKPTTAAPPIVSGEPKMELFTPPAAAQVTPATATAAPSPTPEQEFPELAAMFGHVSPEVEAAAAEVRPTAVKWSPFEKSVPEIVREATVISPDIARLSDVYERVLVETPGSQFEAQDLLTKAVAYSGGTPDYVPAVLYLTDLRGQPLTKELVVEKLPEITRVAREIYKFEVLEPYRFGTAALRTDSVYLDQFRRNISSTPLNTPAKISGFPETYDEYRLAAYMTARDNNLFGGNEMAMQAVAKYCPWAVPLIMAGKYKADDIVPLAYATAILIEGGDISMIKEGISKYTKVHGPLPGRPLLGYQSDRAKDLIVAMTKYAQAADIDPLTLNEFIGHIKQAAQEKGDTFVYQYINSPGQLRKDAKLSGLESVGAAIAGGMRSGEYLGYVGGVLGVVGVGGALLFGGPVAGLAAAPVAVFASTEFANLAQSRVFAEKSLSQQANQWFPDIRSSDRALISTASNMISDFKSTYKDSSPDERRKLLDDIGRAIDDAETACGEHWFAYVSPNEWDNRVSELRSLRARYDHLKSLITDTGELTSGVEGPAQLKIIPTGYTGDYYIEGLPLKLGAQEGERTLDISEPGNYAIVIRDKDGNVLKKTNIFLKPGDIEVISFTGLVGYGKPEAEGPAKLHVYVPAGVVARLGNTVLEGGSEGKFFDLSFDAETRGYIQAESPDGGIKSNYFSVRPGEEATVYLTGGVAARVDRPPTTVEFVVPSYSRLYVGGQVYEGGPTGMSYITQLPKGSVYGWVLEKPGYKTTEGTMYVSSDSYQRIAPDTAKKDHATIVPNLLQGQRMIIDGVEVSPEYHGKEIQITPGLHSIIIDTPGYQPYSATITTYAGESYSVSGIGKPEREQWTPTYGGGGGGGGGDYTPRTPSPTLIVFGPTFKGARIWLDGTEIAPEIGKAYSIQPGYHVVKASLAGYADYSKTVYCKEGSTLTVNAEWTPLGTTTPGQPGAPESEKAIIVLGESCSGATLELDGVITPFTVNRPIEVLAGYHGIRISKPGYEDWIKNMYVIAGEQYMISPVLTPVHGTTTPGETRRVYVNSNPSGAKIILNGGFTGQWTPAYLDLPRGLHTIEFQKSGYRIHSTYVWVGDTVLWGNDALAMYEALGGAA